MITASQIKKVVNANRRYLDIPSRSAMDQMVYFVSDLLKEAGYEDAAHYTKMLGDELENMDTSELAKEKIWID